MNASQNSVTVEVVSVSGRILKTPEDELRGRTTALAKNRASRNIFLGELERFPTGRDEPRECEYATQD